jgi:hypothetical protein
MVARGSQELARRVDAAGAVQLLEEASGHDAPPSLAEDGETIR